jgi:hypothetical protein
LKKFPEQKPSIDLSYFLAKSLAMHSEQSDLAEEHIKEMFLLLQSEITTTDPNAVSINALELAVRKRADSLKLFITDAIMRARVMVETKRLREKEKAMQKTMDDNDSKLRSKLK